MGGGSQTHPAAGWGDYSMLAVDASDGCNFWYTQEYYPPTSTANWKPRIGSFKFPSCTREPSGTLSGTVTDGSAPIAGATVNVPGGYSTVTNAAGHYQLTLVVGSYDVTVSKYGYLDGTATGLALTAGNTTTQNFTLSVAPVSTISGVVTDAITGWPLYARIDIFGYPGGPVFTNPVTGAYSIDLTNGSHTFSVSALSGGFYPQNYPPRGLGKNTPDFFPGAQPVCPSPPPPYRAGPPVFPEFCNLAPLRRYGV